MAVAYDQGFGGVHSPHKQPVAHRMALQLRRVALGEALGPSERGPTLLGACFAAFDNSTNTSTIDVRLNNSDGLFLNATQSCSDCCGPKGNLGMFHVSMASSSGSEQWVAATMAVSSGGGGLSVVAQMGNLEPALVDGHGSSHPIKQQVFGLRYATGNLPQCAVLNSAGIPLAPFNAITIAPACKLATDDNAASVGVGGGAGKANSCIAALSEARCFAPPADGTPTAGCATCAAQSKHRAALQHAGCTADAIAAACSVVQSTVPVPGLRCNGTKKAWVVYLDDGQKHPLVSFAHGYTSWNSTAWMPQLIYGMAARGYVVVASEAAGLDYCLEESDDQIAMLRWARGDSRLAAHIDAEPGTGVIGHSMGGPSRRTAPLFAEQRAHMLTMLTDDAD